MKLLNCTLNEAEKCFGQKKIIFFGRGSWLGMVDYTNLMKFRKQFAYIIDNNCGGQEQLGDAVLDVYKPEKLKSEYECIVILVSPVYMYEMYCQL